MVLIFRVALRVANIGTIFKNLLTTSGCNLCGSMHPEWDFRRINSSKVLGIGRIKGGRSYILGTGVRDPVICNLVTFCQV
jgi:hypothetical protein